MAAPEAGLSSTADLLAALSGLLASMRTIELEEAAMLARIHGHYRSSARSLLHCIAFHRQVHPALAAALRRRGLCSLEGCEPHLQASLQTVISVLEALTGSGPAWEQRQPPPAPEPGELLERCQRLFGCQPASGGPGSLVTLSALDARHPALISERMAAGMTLARIDAAQDDPAVWSRLVAGVAQAREATGRVCRIAIDLPGPTLGIGRLASQPAVIRARPQRDRMGRRLQPARLLAVPEGALPAAVEQGVVLLPVQGTGWKRLKPGDRLQGRDASGRRRRFTVRALRPEGVLLHGRQSCHLSSGLMFRQVGGRARLKVASLPPDPGERWLRTGERLTLTPEPDRGPGTIPCTRSEVFFDLRIGERVLFDGGRIAAVIRSVAAEAVLLEITRASPQGSRLRAGQGIHLPDSDLRTPALTARDLEDLAFATGHADTITVVGVNRESDIAALHRALEGEGREDPALLLRIETRRAFLNLPRLLLMAMRRGSPFGVMIGRDALAVECGWDSLTAIQDEILRLCAAAHVPCLWAGQATAELEPVPLRSNGDTGYPPG